MKWTFALSKFPYLFVVMIASVWIHNPKQWQQGKMGWFSLLALMR